MKTPTVFISHASTDAPEARKMASALEQRGIAVRIDLELAVGDDFVFFMNDALETSDHCLVLWSRNVVLTSYVGAEMSAAFVATVKRHPSYLLIARIDSTPLPALFKPRICVDLFEDWNAGVERLNEFIERDTRVGVATGKPVVFEGDRGSPIQQERRVEIYVCSSVFDRTLLISVDPKIRPEVLLEQVLWGMKAPRRVDHNGRIGVSITYSLRGPRERSGPGLAEEELVDGMVFWLELECELFVIGKNVEGPQPRGMRYRTGGRNGPVRPEAVQQRALEAAASALSDCLRRAGLRSGPLPRTLLHSRQ